MYDYEPLGYKECNVHKTLSKLLDLEVGDFLALEFDFARHM